jgi:PAS domain S-box-containing protein
MSNDALRVVIVDDSADVRELVGASLRAAGGFDVLAEGATADEALTLVADLRPDVLLLDMSMPGRDGIDVIPDVHAASPGTRVVIFTGFDEEDVGPRARALGASDVIEKSLPIEKLADRLRSGPPPPVEHPEDVLTQQIAKFRSQYDDMPIGMATMTLAGCIVRANATLERLVHARRGELGGVHLIELVDDADKEKVNAAIGDVASGRVSSAVIDHRMGSDPNPAWVVSTVANVDDDTGRPLYLSARVQDVTERYIAADQLRASEENFRLLVDSVRDYAIFLLDTEGHVVTWNQGAERTKGYAPNEILGRHFEVFYTPEDRHRAHPQDELAIAVREGRYEEEGWRVRKDGSRFWANVVITALFDGDGAHVGFAKVTRDITERQEILTELQRAVEERRAQLAVTAHELRTPIALVSGFASTLKNHWPDLGESERFDLVERLARAGQRLTRLVEDLLLASRLEAGAVEMRPSSVGLQDLLTRVAADIEETHGVALTVEAEDIQVLADRDRLEQMVTNYLVNAVRHGAPPILVTTTHDRDVAEIRISDHGPGVPEEMQHRLFERFVRGKNAEGTGLGLHIVREMARQQGGEAWHEVPSHGGATFVVRLPLMSAN